MYKPMKKLLHRGRDEQAQNMLEFALLLPILLFLVMGIIDFGFIFSSRIAIANAARTGVRYATTHPTSWSNAPSPLANTIQGAIMGSGSVSSVSNDDSHITIEYSTSSGSRCGHYSESSGYVADAGTQSTCVIPNNLIRVTVTTIYRPITPILRQLVGDSMSVTSSATMVEEQ
ncbi:MAG: pilus assembly protein [Chloroflexota bacterium]|nr:pilus assembly protein [Chloroflexota bacterium]